MKVELFLTLIPALWLSVQAAHAGDPPSSSLVAGSFKRDQPQEQSLPEPLTESNFDAVTSERLTFVEFFSPTCSHCQHLAPIWEETYLTFQEELKQMNIQMKQVNCLASGDLCEREKILFWPNLVLYAPQRDESGKIIPGKSKNVGTMPRSLTRTVDNFKKYLRSVAAEYDAGEIDLPSSSTLLSVDDMLNLVSGNIEEPQFVAFFPATDNEWQQTELGVANFHPSCYDCQETKATWDKLSNQILSTCKTGHFNCMSNPTICTKLGFSSLTKHRSAPAKFAMFLPKSAGVIRLNYNDNLDITKMKSFALRLFENFHYNAITKRSLEDIMLLQSKLPHHPLNSFYPLENKQALIFYFEPSKVTEEDKAILPYLLELVTQSPFNIYLYSGKESKNYNNLLKNQPRNLIEFINYDENAIQPYEFNEEMDLTLSLTSKPTLLLIKENSLMTPIYQNFAIEDMRDIKKIEKWFLKNQYPLYQELTPSMFTHYFNTKVEKNNYNDKVVVSFIDSKDAAKTSEALYNMSLIAHEYHFLKNMYYFDKLTDAREVKRKAVEKLKEGKASSTKIINRMKKQIRHLYDKNDVLFTFIDVSENPSMARKLGWDVSGKNYGKGDTIVVTKTNKFYWDTTIDGKRLQTDPYLMKPVLQYLLDPKLVSGTKVKLSRKLVGSPYGDSLRFMDTIHRYGFFAYLLLIGFIYTSYISYIKLRKRSSRVTSPGLGIIATGKSD